MVQEKDDARQRMLKLANLTEEQQFVVDIFLREKSEKLRHWERRSGDDNIYIEYLNGCILLDHMIDNEIDKIRKRNERQRKK